MKKYDISAIGELLVDCIPAGVNENNVPLFSTNPGGAPANVLASFAKLKGETALISKVGNDAFGKFLVKSVENAKIDTSGIIFDSNYNTTLAFVQLDEFGDRSFSFYRKPGADIMLTVNELSENILKNSKFFHFGSVSLTDEPVRTATLTAVKTAKENGAIITYDPNYRPLLWESEEIAQKNILEMMPFADILKISDEELILLTGEKSCLKGSKILSELGPKLVFVTSGKNGASYYTENCFGELPTYDVNTIDTTGAGDTFFGTVLWQIKNKSLEEIKNFNENELTEIVNFSNAAGSLATTKKGAIPAMPDYNEILDCIKNTKRF